MITTEKICNHLLRLLHAPIRSYDANGSRVAFRGDDDINDPLSCDAAFEKTLLKKGKEKCPVFYIERDCVIYIIVRKSDGGSLIAGPVLAYGAPGGIENDVVRLHNMDKEYPYKLSRRSMDVIYECALMLFESVSDLPLTREQMLTQNHDVESLRKSIDKNMMSIYSDFRERSATHNPYSQEMREQESIRTGDIDALRASINEVYDGELGKMAKTSLRSVKNLAITVLALSSRSAIAGGVLPEIAFSLSDAYALKIEEMTTESEVEVVARTAEFHFANLVREHIDNAKSNPIIMGCKDYVLKHITKRITLKEIAEAIEVNASYLSDLFSKQEGMTLSEYISREKINFAKRRLLYTNLSYGEIAYEFSFSSQSHFGRVFKKYTGMTPKEFREKNKAVEVQ